MSVFTFGNLSYLLFLLIIPCMLLLFIIVFRFRKKQLFQIFHHTAFSKLIPEFSLSRKMMKHSLGLVSLVFIVLTLARPQILNQTLEERVEGIEIIFLIDVSRSMLTQDVRPNRLSLLKVQLNRFIDSSKKNHRMGLIAFAGSAFLISPLTSDLGLIQNYIHSLSVDMVSSQGTDFKLALQQVEKSFQGGSLHRGITRVLIIASDGENHEVGALEKIRFLSRQGIRIFTLGFGTESGGPIMLEKDLYQKDEKGQVVQSQFKPRTLKEFAKIGKGAFYHVTSSDDFAEKLHQDLQILDQQVFEKRSREGRAELFQYFLFIGLLFSFLYWGMSERKG